MKIFHSNLVKKLKMIDLNTLISTGLSMIRYGISLTSKMVLLRCPEEPDMACKLYIVYN